MPTYNVYLLRGKTRSPHRCFDFYAVDDAQAAAFVRHRLGHDPVEIRSQGRMISIMEPEGPRFPTPHRWANRR